MTFHVLSEDQREKIQEAIEAKVADLHKVEERKAAAQAGGDATTLAEMTMQETALRGQIRALEGMRAVVDAPAPKVPRSGGLLLCLEKYKSQKREKLNKIGRAIGKNEQEIARYMGALRKATQEADTSKAMEYAEKLQKSETERGYLQEMMSSAQKMPVYPDGALDEEWDNLCRQQMPEWEFAVRRVELLASEYKAACADLRAMAAALTTAREAMMAEAKQEGGAFYPIQTFTCGLAPEKMVLERRDYQWIHQLKSPFTGDAL